MANTTQQAETAAHTTPAPKGWRHEALWLYLVMLVASLVALYVSFILSGETLQLARHPQQSLGCDINSVLSCSTVAQSWQAEVIHFQGLSFPNAFFGIAAETVFVVIAVLGVARIALPRWFNVATWWGGLAALAYAYWLFSQSLFVIQALCPWCLALMFSTTIQFMALTHATITVRDLPHIDGKLGGLRRFYNSYYRFRIDLVFDVVWILLLIGVILVKDGAAIFA
jgi:uncharacterized membrane protein